MTDLVTLAVAGDIAEAEEIHGVLRDAGIECALEAAEGDVMGGAPPGDGPCRVLVGAHELEPARDALLAAAEADAAD